jgi:hypothetical protein
MSRKRKVFCRTGHHVCAAKRSYLASTRLSLFLHTNAQNSPPMSSRLVSMLRTLYAIRVPLSLPLPSTLSLTVFRRPTTQRSTNEFRAHLKASLSKCYQSEATENGADTESPRFLGAFAGAFVHYMPREDWSRTVYISGLPLQAIEEDVRVLFKESKLQVYVNFILRPSVVTKASIPLTIFTAIVSS